MTRQLRAMGRSFGRLARDERGGETMEYAMTLGFLAIAAYVLIRTVGGKFVDLWTRVDRALAHLG